MSYCQCGEDGMIVMECWECSREKCEDCATPMEITDQHCKENCCEPNEELSRLSARTDGYAGCKRR